MADLVQYYGTGRRKSSVARVFLRPGNGDFTINGRKFDEYFVTEAQRYAARRPLQTSETAGTFNVIASVSGGGVNGQSDAVKMGPARGVPGFKGELCKGLKAEGLPSCPAWRK